jgi:two-component system nitrogen regulation sensor histidine kinase NtrY
MNNTRVKSPKPFISENERRKRKREVLLIVSIIAVVAVLTYAESRILHFGADLPVSNTILMFFLININLLFLILLIFLVIRNLVKLLYDRKRNVMGAKLRSKLVIAFLALTLLPTAILFFFSINFITTSIEFWFNAPVEQALENSLNVGRSLYQYAEEHNRFFLERIAYQIKTKKLIDCQQRNDLCHYIRIVQRSFNLHGVEVYAADSNRIACSFAPKLMDKTCRPVSIDKLQKEKKATGVRTIIESISEGELIRTIGNVPFGAKGTDAKAFIVLTNLISPDLSEYLASISMGFEEYKQMQLMKKPTQTTYYITLSIVALLVVFCAVWLGFHLAKSITIPIMELAEGTRKVAEGDLGFSIGRVADDEIGSLVDSFNKMTRDLRIVREQLELSARMLRDQNLEIESRRQYMEIVLRNVSTGVLTFDAGGFITTANKAAERMLNLCAEDILNKSYKKILKSPHSDLAKEVMENLSFSRNGSVEFPFKMTIDGRHRSFMVHVNVLKDDAGHHMGIVIVLDDLTELEKAQRIAAWREVARRIAHEVKNPLTPITLSAQRLKRKYSERIDDPVFEECTQMIIDQVDLIKNLVGEFSSYARFPSANPQSCELQPIIREAVAIYRESHPHINFNLNMSENIPPMNLDRQQIKQAMTNLIDNAIVELREQGNIFITLSHDPILNKVRIEVADDGTGITDEDKTRLFEPYFSKKKSGMGLGLTIVSSIVADHNGMIRVQDNQPRGAKFVIELPL